jgi:hypothetical protein
MQVFHRPNTLLCVQNGLTIVFNVIGYQVNDLIKLANHPLSNTCTYMRLLWHKFTLF